MNKSNKQNKRFKSVLIDDAALICNMYRTLKVNVFNNAKALMIYSIHLKRPVFRDQGLCSIKYNLPSIPDAVRHILKVPKGHMLLPNHISIYKICLLSKKMCSLSKKVNKSKFEDNRGYCTLFILSIYSVHIYIKAFPTIIKYLQC